MDLSAILLSLALHVARLHVPRISETTLVVDYAPSVSSPRAVTTLDRQALIATPAATVDDALRSVPGFSLFRRSSSRVANPTTQGATLRGLAASGSSRALVLGDGIPLNDPVGGWVYWNRVPVVALDELAVARGASGDYGIDAVGGVVSIASAMHPGVRFLAEGGSDETGRLSAYGGRAIGDARLFGAVEAFRTDGFVIVEPATRRYAGGIPPRVRGDRLRARHAQELHSVTSVALP
jgi:outer membrane cobalamin receptor